MQDWLLDSAGKVTSHAAADSGVCEPCLMSHCLWTKQEVVERNQYRDLFASQLFLDLLPVANSRQRLFVRVDRRADIRALLDWAVQHKIKLVLVGTREAWLEAKRIGKAGAVILERQSTLISTVFGLEPRFDDFKDAGVRSRSVHFRPTCAQARTVG